MLCTILLASWQRPNSLLRSIESFHQTAKPENFEIIVRLSEPDTASIARIPEFLAFGNVRVLVSAHLGYNFIGTYFTEMAPLARGRWIHIHDDDMTIEGSGWDEQLARLALDQKLFVTCEFYVLQQSRYRSGSCGPTGWFVPTRCWEKYGEKSILDPPDLWMRQLLVDQNGWTDQYLEGITLNHENWRQEIPARPTSIQ